MKKLLLIPAFTLFACSGEEAQLPPPGLIPAEKIIPLIVDLQVLESHYEGAYQHPQLFKDALDSSSQLLFTEYGVTKQQFDQSYSYYARDITAIYSIYEAALDSVNFRLNLQTF